MAKPRRGNPVEHWQQLELLLTFPEQRTYERIRPIVLFGQSVHSSAAETGSVERTLQRQVKRFEAQGMHSLFAPDLPPQPDALPDDIRQHILNLKAEHPPLRVHELATICDIRFGRRPHASTIKRILEETPPPPRTPRRIPPYHTITAPTERRLAVIRLHREGWTKQSIADYLQTSRQTVHETLQRWVEEGIGGLVRQIPGTEITRPHGQSGNHRGGTPSAAQPRIGRVPHSGGVEATWHRGQSAYL
jgi:transposase